MAKQKKPHTPFGKDLRQDDTLLRNITGCIARQVDGVAYLGDGMLREMNCRAGTCADPGQGVHVRRWQEDIWIYIHLGVEPDTDLENLREILLNRVQSTLENMLGIRATAIELQVQSPQNRYVPPLAYPRTGENRFA